MHRRKCIQLSKRIKNMVEKEIRLISETLLFVFGDILRCGENRRFPVSFRTDIYSNLKFAFIVLARLIVVTKKGLILLIICIKNIFGEVSIDRQ